MQIRHTSVNVRGLRDMIKRFDYSPSILINTNGKPCVSKGEALELCDYYLSRGFDVFPCGNATEKGYCKGHESDSS
jgi:hypothetical protein